MEAGHYHLTPFRVSVGRSGERTPQSISLRFSPSLARAAMTCGEHVVGHVHTSESARRTSFAHQRLSFRFVHAMVAFGYRLKAFKETHPMEWLRGRECVVCDACNSRAGIATAACPCVIKVSAVCDHISGVRESLATVLGGLSASKRSTIAWCQCFFAQRSFKNHHTLPYLVILDGEYVANGLEYVYST